MKSASSRIHAGKGSMTHIGTTPYRFRIEIFVSYVDHVKNVSEVCVTWERRGNTEATNLVKVKDNKAVFKHTLSMESTLFRRVNNAKGAPSTNQDQLQFDEKKAKVVLRKGSSTGKAVGKIHINMADYIRGPTSTVFADMKLSNGSIIVSRIEATMLHMGKKKKNDSRAGSEACSEMTDANSIEDSLFGDDDADLGDIEIETTPVPVDGKTPGTAVLSPVSSASASSTTASPTTKASGLDDLVSNGPMKEASSSPSSLKGIPGAQEDNYGPASSSSAALRSNYSQRGSRSLKSEKGDEELKESPSLRLKLKKKMKTKKKEKDPSKGGNASSTGALPPQSPEKAAEVAELKNLVESLKKENTKLKASKQAAMDEIDALRTDLEACEASLEVGRISASQPRRALDMSKTLKEKDKTITALEAQNESFLQELEELHGEAVQGAGGVESAQITSLQKKIEDLEIALRREPQYMDVVNELKVTKVSLALANMEKEQALFALQTHRGQKSINNN